MSVPLEHREPDSLGPRLTLFGELAPIDDFGRDKIF
jgi:hypothetical protein